MLGSRQVREALVSREAHGQWFDLAGQPAAWSGNRAVTRDVTPERWQVRKSKDSGR